MRFIADLHIHSRFSRATSREMTLENLAYWAQLKGIKVMGTGDFTYPRWFFELKEKLFLEENGLYRLSPFKTEEVPSSCRSDIYFVPTVEVSCIYKKGERIRKVHLIVILPTLEDVSILNARLANIGNITADGRPILGFDAKELLRVLLDVSESGLLIPAHAWTPHFSVFGASSGFDSLEECFEELTSYIYAIETGLSSDPQMNWRLSTLDNVTLISNSDAHSLSKIGREANIFKTNLSYHGIVEAIKKGKGFEGTIEFFPAEGKYHYDGHRSCSVRFSPDETIKHNYRCPVCGRKVTIGVMHRVIRLADRDNGYRPRLAKRFYTIIPLCEIIAEALKMGVGTKKVLKHYLKIISEIGPEFSVLIDASLCELERVGGKLIAEGIRRMREGMVSIEPGYDGEFGKIHLFEGAERAEIKGQEMLF